MFKPKPNDFLKVTDTRGNWRFGYVVKVIDRGMALVISFDDEGTNKLAFDEAQGEVLGLPKRDWQRYLSPVELELVPLIAAGTSTDDIAACLHKTPSTVRGQLRSLRLKLGLDNKVQMVVACQGLWRKVHGRSGQDGSGTAAPD